jgi:hypothetical protein
MARDKNSLMRLLKSKLLELAATIPFVTEEMTKEQIADAIVMMEPPESPVVPSFAVPGTGPEARHSVPGDPDYPVSARVARVHGKES